LDFTTLKPVVLCVDSDPETRELMESVLPNCQISFAGNAYEALREVNARPHHAYLLEYWLPDWSGPSLCREIRKVDPHAPIVFCSSAAREQDRARGMRAGADAYLCKPVQPDELRGKLKALVTLSELESLRARVDEEQAVLQELKRRRDDAMSRVEHARRLETASLERTARSRAYKAFLAARGTRMHFENWWPQVFTSATANDGVAHE
jgi:DNA-binding response OmpR family regulator